MKRSLWIAGAMLLGACLAAPPARAQNAPPPPPGAAPPGLFPGGVPGQPPGAPPSTTHATSQPAQPMEIPGVRTVMVFPFDNNSEFASPTLGAALAGYVRQGLERSGVYSSIMYNLQDPMVQRALKENQTDLGGPSGPIAAVINKNTGAVDPVAAMKIAARTGMQGVLLGSIEQLTYDKATNKVTLVATAQILNPITGEPLRTAGVTGSASGAPSADEGTVALAAVQDAASRILTSLGVPPGPPQGGGKGHHHRKQPPVESQAEEGSHHRVQGWIPAGILLGILATALR